MGTALAFKEGTAPVPGTPAMYDDWLQELRDLSHRLDAVRRLQTYGAAPNVLNNQQIKPGHFFLLELDSAIKQLKVSSFQSNDLQKATDQYLEAEKRAGASGSQDAVLVSVDSLASLAKAYPNYFLDTNFFVELVQEALA